MPGQFKNTGTNPGGKVSLVNRNDAGNLAINKGVTPNFIVNIFAKNQDVPSGAGFDIQYYYTPVFGWGIVGTGTNITSTSCDQYGYLNGSGISSFDFRIVRTGTNQTILFDRDFSSTCPNFNIPYCGINLPLTPYATPYYLAFTVQVAGGDYVNC